jgi:hypothetical protein
MAEQALPTVNILGFKTTYHRKPGITELEERDWVEYSPVHDPKAVNVEMVKFLKPPENPEEDTSPNAALKVGYMAALWRQIEPAYKAWKEGKEIPIDGTPLAAWAGVTPEQIKILHQNGLKTVQAVSTMTESQMNKVMLPNIRNLKQTALEYLGSREKVAQAEEVADLKAKLEALTEMMAERQDAEAVAKRGPGRPPKVKPEQEAAA